jgi:ABC-type antimicrobial peptide transport system permease subunit
MDASVRRCCNCFRALEGTEAIAYVYDPLRQILGEGLITASLGIALGSIGAYFVGRAMRGILFGVGTIDPLAFSIVATLLLCASVLACIIPALRAASVDPMTALRDG